MQPLACDLWLMEPNALRGFSALARSDISVNLEQIRENAPRQSRNKAIGILPVHGVLQTRRSLIGELLGMSSYEAIGQGFDSLMSDDSVGGIILDVASPGGMVYGCQELADKIFQARGKKPIIAVANPMAASGAFWIASAADRLVVTPSGDVGSVGVIWEHVDLSKAMENEGATVTVIRSSASPHKAESNDLEPLTPEARASMQARADGIYTKFVGDLARFRGVPVDHVNEHFGKGRVVQAQHAIKAGMADRVDTFEGVVMKMASGRIRIASERSQDDWEVPTERDRRRMEIASLEAFAKGDCKNTEIAVAKEMQ